MPVEGDTMDVFDGTRYGRRLGETYGIVLICNE